MDRAPIATPSGLKAEPAPGFRLRRMGRALTRDWRWLVLGLVLGLLVGLFGRQQLLVPRLSVELVSNRRDRSTSAGGARYSSPATLAEDLQRASRLATDPRLLGRAITAAAVPFSVDEVLSAAEILPEPAVGSLVLHFQTSQHEAALRLLDAWARELIQGLEAATRESTAVQQAALAERLRTTDHALAALGAELSATHVASLGDGANSSPLALLRRTEELDLKGAGLRDRLVSVDAQIENLHEEMARFSPALAAAKEELYRALIRYTEEHPKVRALRATVASLENSARAQTAPSVPDPGAAPASPAASLYGQWVSRRNERLGFAKELESVGNARTQLQASLPAAATNSVRQAGLEARFQLLSSERVATASALQQLALTGESFPAQFVLGGPPRLDRPGPRQAHLLWTVPPVAGVLGLLLALGLVLLVDVAQGRIHVAEDLQRASGLPVLGVLCPLEDMSLDEMEQWAFQTFTRLKGRLTRSNDEALVCGVISARSGEGSSTVVWLLTEAALKQGYRVMSVAVGAEPAGPPAPIGVAPAGGSPSETSLLPRDLSQALASHTPALGGVLRLSASRLTLDLRAQWREILEQAGNASRLVLVADLPPASSQQGVLLAESFPNLLWVAAQGTAGRAETRASLSLLEDARCHLIGAVMNSLPKPVRKRRTAPLWSAATLAFVLAHANLQAQSKYKYTETIPAPSPTLPARAAAPPAQASPSAPVPEAPSAATWHQYSESPSLPAPSLLSNAVLPSALAPQFATPPVSPRPLKVATGASKVPYLAPWQERFTLGPGDVMEISLHDQPESARKGLFIGPDGRLNYLLANEVEAAGLTVDELRAKLEDILGKYYPAPRVIINPAAYNSKKYFILGNVQNVGPFSLNRPVTILEAVARAGGFVSSAEYRNVIVQADLSRSFLARTDSEGVATRVPVDFEAIMMRGDLSQNITLDPGDYLYFPPIDVQEIYVLGAVNAPGVTPFSPDLSAIAAIVSRGGFADKAYRSKLLVIRGSLNDPQKFIVDATAILAARQKDFPLQNKDIIYVSRRPFAKAEELAESAVTSFVNGLIWGWTQNRVIPNLPY